MSLFEWIIIVQYFLGAILGYQLSEGDNLPRALRLMIASGWPVMAAILTGAYAWSFFSDTPEGL
jgi:hypothetical protein